MAQPGEGMPSLVVMQLAWTAQSIASATGINLDAGQSLRAKYGECTRGYSFLQTDTTAARLPPRGSQGGVPRGKDDL